MTGNQPVTVSFFAVGEPVENGLRYTQLPAGSRLPPRNPEQRGLIGLKLRRTDSDKAAKHSGEVAWIRKSRDSGCVQHCAPRITQRNLRPFDSLLQHITVRRAPHASLE